MHARPVIGSDDPAVAAVVSRLGAGPVVPAADPRALADALRRLLADDESVSAYAAAASAAVRPHSVAAVTDATRAVYRAVLAGGVGGAGVGGAGVGGAGVGGAGVGGAGA
jgi:glycosyltransferase involved in cell wall biosynthesis